MPSQVLHDSFYSHALNKQKNYSIYLPPSLFHREDPLPVLYLMSGLLDYEKTWVEKGKLNQAADTLISEGKINEMIIVMPDKDDAVTETGREFDYGHYISYELVEHIERNYPVLSSSTYRGLEGLSVGSYWALNLGIYAPGTYSSVSSLSGHVYPNFYEGVEKNLDALLQSKTRFRLSCGDAEDPHIIEENNKFSDFLNSLGLHSEFCVEAGPHDWPLWQTEIYNSLQFHSYSFSLS